ncbi:hypothetical protein CYMTET_48165 [Cymbomonas tetramitiformis]|uniref:ATP-dependent DNA helicase n=1 Tax=Cymbomonas tetramitiformis TaxID=36881 RepID=A0AAE0BTV6_9CHLO|nr:hypothetical protein CYMTET_48165 [Cymbomonas tetramitiformis]
MRAINYRDMQRMCPKAKFYINRRSPSTREICMEMKQLVCGDRACMDGYSSTSRNGHRTSGPMEHGPHPYDDYRPAKWCKKTEQGFCKSVFPRPCGDTRKVDNGFIELKRREGPQIRSGWTAGDEFVVAYNVWMLFKYKTHINVEIAAKVSVIAYLYKYLFKGGDRARYEIRRDANGNEVVDEIADWKQGMYTSATEACWLLWEMDKFNNSPVVDVMDVHLITPHSREDALGSSEFEKYVFRPPEVDAYAQEHFNVHALTATEFRRLFMATTTAPADVKAQCEDVFGKRCKVDPTALLRSRPHTTFYMRDAPAPDAIVRPVWFRDMHAHGGTTTYYYPCQPADRHIARLQRVYKVGSELWYFRMFVMNKPIPLVTEDTARDPLKPILELTPEKTFQSVARLLHLVPHEHEAEIAMAEAVASHATPSSLISLFVVLTIGGYPTERLLNAPEHAYIREAMCIEFVGAEDDRHQKLLVELKRHFEANGKTLTDYDIEEPALIDCSELAQHRSYWKAQSPMLTAYLAAHKLFSEQQRIVDRVKVLLGVADTNTASTSAPRPSQNSSAFALSFPIIFIDGPAGTGKTTTITHLLYDLRLNHDKVCLASATTALAAQLYHQGETVHALAKLNVTKVNEEIIESMLQDDDSRMELLGSADVIVVDEAPSLLRGNLEALTQVLERAGFRGVLILSGDFRQIAPVVRGGGRADIVDASPRRSPLWPHVEVHCLTELRRQPDDSDYAKIATAIGDDTHIKELPTEGADDPTLVSGASLVDLSIIPDAQRFTGDTLQDALHFVFSENVDDFDESAILATSCAAVNFWNTKIQEQRNIDGGAMKTYISHNSVNDSFAYAEDFNSSDFLNSREENGVPLHELTLAVNDMCYLMRTINKKVGLVTSTRLRVVALHERSVHVIIVGDHTNTVHIIPRITFIFSPQLSNLEIHRRQFPLCLAYAMTVNRSQGQTLKRVLLDTTRPAFSHGHLYVALSRVRDRHSIALFNRNQIPSNFQLTVAYSELLKDDTNFSSTTSVLRFADLSANQTTRNHAPHLPDEPTTADDVTSLFLNAAMSDFTISHLEQPDDLFAHDAQTDL